VGKWVAVKEAAERISRSIMEIREEHSLTRIREVQDWLRMRPIADRHKVVLIDFDRISVEGQNALLKTLEEPPDHGRIFGVASKQVLPTVWSRCHVVRFSTLRTIDVYQILRGLDKPEMLSRELSRVSGGSVERALLSEAVVSCKGDIVAFLSTLAREDRGSMWQISKRWDDDHTTALWRWLVESLADRAEVFSEADLRLRHDLGSRRTRKLAGLMTQMTKIDPSTLALEIWRR
jgi:DNA polymerase III delta prime subunit